MKGRRVFVSGGAGVIGSEIVPKLIARGADVLVGDLKTRPREFAAQVRYRQGDLNTLLLGELIDFAPDVFIHLAATFERSSESAGFWDENFHHNVALSHHLMTLARDIPSLRRVVFASSYLIYDPALYNFASPQAEPVSLRESDHIQPRNLTGMAKLSHEMELRFLGSFPEYRFSTLCVRIYRGYGCNSRDVISRWVRALLASEAITLFRPEGIFDYIYARDSAEGLIRLAESESTQGIINLGSGRSRRVSDVIDVLRRSFPELMIQEAASDDAYEASQADLTALSAAINWVPEYDLERSVPEIIAFERGRLADATQLPPASNVLITSAARKAPLIRAMQAAGRKLDGATRVIAGDLDPEALCQFVADDFWLMPRTDESKVQELVEGCHARGIGIVLPTRDGELMFWARARDEFQAAGIQVVVSDATSVNRCLDKLEFARFGREQGLPVIAAEDHPDAVGPGPFVVKERFGAGSRSIGLNLDREAALALGARLTAPIYQRFVTGIEVSIDSWMDSHGTPRGVILRRRDKVVDGESQVTTTFRDARLESAAVAALRALDLRGPAVMQAILDTGGGLHIIECNTRFGGASTTAIAAGLEMLYWSLLEARDRTAVSPFHRSLGEVRQVRVAADVVLHDPDL